MIPNGFIAWALLETFSTAHAKRKWEKRPKRLNLYISTHTIAFLEKLPNIHEKYLKKKINTIRKNNTKNLLKKALEKVCIKICSDYAFKTN